MSNYNVDTLENKIIVEAQEAIKSLEQIIGYVKESKNAVDSLKSATGLKSVDKEAKQATSSLTKMQSISKNLRKALNFSGLIYGAKKTFDFLSKSTENSIDYVETLNLFEVSMGKTLDAYGNMDIVSSQYYTKALNFQKRLNEAFGTNIEETMRYQALYNQMTKSMGINENASNVISENLTKLGIDLASLFNKEEAATMEALRAGVLAGQTKPLRNYGLDVTQQSMKPILGELGIDKTVNELSQAEKMILRYITVLRQASASHGDFAKTIESPANQLKVLKSQFEELRTAIGNLFQGLLGQILPVVNAIIMVTKELVKALAGLFGVKVTSANNNLAKSVGIDDLDAGVANVGAGLGGAAKNAKELKNQLMGFDEINNIVTETSSSGGGGGAGGGLSAVGIDGKLLDALSEYDNLMNKVKMKATDIRDKIMDWLGFTKLINPLTGEISWKLRDGETNLKKIWTAIKAVLGLYVGVKVLKLIGYFRNLFSVLATGKTTGLTPFVSGLTGIKNAFTGIKAWIGIGIDNFKSVYKETRSLGAAFKSTASGMLDLIPAAVKATVGIAGLAVSMYGAYDSMKDFSEGTKTAGAAFAQLGLSVAGAAASGALIGSIFGPVGAAIGAVIGALGSLIAAMVGYQTEAQIMAKQNEEFNKSVEDMAAQMDFSNQKIIDAATNMNTEVASAQNLKAQLSDLVDENGNLKEGYEERAEFILGKLNEALGTEYTLNDLIKGKYQEIIDEIDKLINKKKEQIIMSTLEEKYKEAVNNSTEAVLKQAKAEELLNQALEQVELDKYSEDIKGLYDEWNNLSDAEREAAGSFEEYAKSISSKAFWLELDLGKGTKSVIHLLSDQDNAYKTSSKVVEQYRNDLLSYNEALVLAEEGKTAELGVLFDQQKFKVNETNKGIEQSYGDTITAISKQIDYYKGVLENGTAAQKQAAETEIKIQQEKLDAVSQSLHQQAIEVEKMTPTMIEDWRKLANSSRESYAKALEGLDKDTQKEIQLATGVIVNELGIAKPKVETKAGEIRNTLKNNLGQNMIIDPTVTVKPTVSIVTTGAQAAIRAFNSAMTSSLSNASAALASLTNLNRTPFRAYAGGGLPDIGEVFLARERGPELVGRIGSRTAVANNSQIVEAVSRGVFEAVSAAMPNGSTVSLDIRADEGIIVKKAANGFKEFVMQTGELPFPVPV